jgi:hypothetical protein
VSPLLTFFEHTIASRKQMNAHMLSLYLFVYDPCASQHLGYYEFEECEGTNPTIGMEIGQTYTFMQTDISNYYHPM